MKPSSKVEYALLALLELASSRDRKVSLRVTDIAAKQGIPSRYLEQILTSLRRNGIVQSQRGAKGGHVLARAPWQITLLEVIASEASDGVVKEEPNDKRATPEKLMLREIWQEAEQASHSVLERYTLQDLCQKRDAYQQTNPMYYI